MSDGDLLLRAVLADPDDDTVRLAWADWLQEHGEEDRAELIRIQCGAYAMPADCLWPATVRASALLAANADRWRRGPQCGACKGKGRLHFADWSPPGDAYCDTCRGTGDAGGLMELQVPENEGDGLYRFPVTYHRGTKTVYCDLSDVCRNECTKCRGYDNTHCVEYCDGAFEFRPTPWALAVAKCHPDVTEFWVGDREPEEHRSVGQGTVTYSWYCDGFQDDRATVPEPVLDEMRSGVTGLSSRRKAYPTEQAARTELARAVCRWVRSRA